MRTRRGPRRALGPERTREGPGHCKSNPCQSKLLWNFVSHISICSLLGLSTAKLRPISGLQNSSYFGRVHLGLPSFNFLRSHFFLFVRAAFVIINVIIKPNCSQNVAPKMGPPRSPIFGTYGGHFCGRSETSFNGIGGPKLGPPRTQIETQNWCQFWSPSFDTICLPRDAISKYIDPACQV